MLVFTDRDGCIGLLLVKQRRSSLRMQEHWPRYTLSAGTGEVVVCSNPVTRTCRLPFLPLPGQEQYIDWLPNLDLDKLGLNHNTGYIEIRP